MFFNESYTAEEVNSAPSYSLIPRGEYIAQIEKWELKDNKNGGNRIACQVRILDGRFQNKVLFTDITMESTFSRLLKSARSTAPRLLVLSATCNRAAQTIG